MHAKLINEMLMPMLRAAAHHCGLTWILGFTGMILATVGQRRLAGLTWFALGAGSVGVAFTRATDNKTLKFDNVRHELNDDEIDFLAGHLPFLLIGLLALLQPEDD